MNPSSMHTSKSNGSDATQQQGADVEATKEVVAEKALGDGWATDLRNPHNWPARKRWSTVAIVSLYEFLPPMGSCMMGPGLPEIAARYDIRSATVLNITLSVFALSQGIGPLFFAPLSEMFGRVPVLWGGNVFLIFFNIACVFAPTASSFTAFRFLAGLAGSAPLACGGGVVADVFTPQNRAGAMALYVVGPLVGPALGPTVGGFVSQFIGVKYVFVILAGLSAIAAVIGLLQAETYAPVIRAKINRATGEYPLDSSAIALKLDVTTFWINIKRPTILLTRSLICFMLSLYMASIFGMYYLMFTTFPGKTSATCVYLTLTVGLLHSTSLVLFEDVYGFKVGVGGLSYLGLALGFFGGSFFGVKVVQKIYLQLVKKNRGKAKPEMRIPALMFGSLFIPIGLFWYGWSAQARIHWIMPMIGTAFFGFGMVTSFMPINLYLADTFQYAASAISAAVFFRAFCGFTFPLFGQQMYNALGYGGGNSLLAGWALVVGVPFPVFLYFKGEALRARSKYARHD